MAAKAAAVKSALQLLPAHLTAPLVAAAELWAPATTDADATTTAAAATAAAAAAAAPVSAGDEAADLAAATAEAAAAAASAGSGGEAAAAMKRRRQAAAAAAAGLPLAVLDVPQAYALLALTPLSDGGANADELAGRSWADARLLVPVVGMATVPALLARAPGNAALVGLVLPRPSFDACMRPAASGLRCGVEALARLPLRHAALPLALARTAGPSFTLPPFLLLAPAPEGSGGAAWQGVELVVRGSAGDVEWPAGRPLRFQCAPPPTVGAPPALPPLLRARLPLPQPLIVVDSSSMGGSFGGSGGGEGDGSDGATPSIDVSVGLPRLAAELAQATLGLEAATGAVRIDAAAVSPQPLWRAPDPDIPWRVFEGAIPVAVQPLSDGGSGYDPLPRAAAVAFAVSAARQLAAAITLGSHDGAVAEAGGDEGSGERWGVLHLAARLSTRPARDGVAAMLARTLAGDGGSSGGEAGPSPPPPGAAATAKVGVVGTAASEPLSAIDRALPTLVLLAFVAAVVAVVVAWALRPV